MSQQSKTKLVIPKLQNSMLEFPWKPPCDIICIDEWLRIAIEKIHCFFLVIRFDLDFDKIVYVLKNIDSYFGYSQDELIKHSLFEFILPSNHDRLLIYRLNGYKGCFFYLKICFI
ncbi:unnamed protein product [Adineta steineri]|uniref:PAS domain-containing protein n=1 Tax=Adineta steineri TaxID=433720 RepID=A0A815JC49_9BILA|nr:unnamed protein product [Adineta steineri]